VLKFVVSGGAHGKAESPVPPSARRAGIVRPGWVFDLQLLRADGGGRPASLAGQSRRMWWRSNRNRTLRAA